MPKVKKQFKVVHRESDKVGNMLIVEQEPVYGNYRLLLHLVSEKKPRHIGEVDTKQRTLLVQRDRAKHLFLKNNSYGFNYKIISSFEPVDRVLLHETDGSNNNYFLIPEQVVREESKTMNFKQQGFELQVFLEYAKIKQYAVNHRWDYSNGILI